MRSRKTGLATQLRTSSDMPHRVSYRFPLRTASTTWRIESITSCGCSLCISWPLFVLVMCFAFGTSRSAASAGSIVGGGEQRRRHGEAERPGGLGVDDQFELTRLHDRQVRG